MSTPSDIMATSSAGYRTARWGVVGDDHRGVRLDSLDDPFFGKLRRLHLSASGPIINGVVLGHDLADLTPIAKRPFQSNHGVNHRVLNLRPSVAILQSAKCYVTANSSVPAALPAIPFKRSTEYLLNLCFALA